MRDLLLSSVPLIATCTSIALALSPMASVRQAISSGALGTLGFTPLHAMYLNNVANLVFGLSIRDAFISGVAGLNGAISLLYIVAFYALTPHRAPVRRALLASHLVLLSSYAWISTQPAIDTAYHTGMVANVAGVIMFGSPLVSLRDVVRTKSTASLPVRMCLTGFVCAGTWTMYGMQLGNAFVIIPNGLGFLLACVQLSLFCIYPRTAQASDDKRHSRAV